MSQTRFDEPVEIDALQTDTIRQGDCLEVMQNLPEGSVDLVFADPPFNIGYEYDEYHDEQDDEEYVAWSRAWIGEVHRILKPNGTFWLAIGDEYAAELKVAAEHQIGFKTRSWVVWYYTFGVNCTRKFSRSHVHLFHFVKNDKDFVFNSEDPQIRVPSARALVYADKRANPAGRLPDDTWILRPQDLPEGFQPADDTWYYARVAGTFKERQGFHGCQMPEQLLGRIVRASSNPGALVLDPFAGSGTTLAVAKKLGREWLGIELSADYVEAATQRLNAIQVGDPLDGPADPIGSAPSTGNGRRLTEENSPPSKGVARGGIVDETTNSTRPGATGSVSAAREAIRSAIVDAFYAAHHGYSTDRLLVDPALQTRFHEACRESGLIGNPIDWNHELIRLRKQGGIPKRGDIKRVAVSATEMDAYAFAAEIAWQLTRQKFAGASLDEILCDPDKAAWFDRVAERAAPGFSPAEYRWAALHLRKASKSLVREMKKYHYVFASRDFERYFSLSRKRLDDFAGQPGLYCLRADRKSKTRRGETPLYIGLALDLGHRLQQHMAAKLKSPTVSQVSVLTADDLPSRDYWGAMVVDLVRRHQPQWNVDLVGMNVYLGD